MFCDACNKEGCCELSCLESFPHISDTEIPSRARLSLPSILSLRPSLPPSVVTRVPIPRNTVFGPLVAPSTANPCATTSHHFIRWSDDGSALFVDTSDENCCNWMALLQPQDCPGNIKAVHRNGNIYFLATENMSVEETLKLYLGIHLREAIKKVLLDYGQHPALKFLHQLCTTNPSAVCAVQPDSAGLCDWSASKNSKADSGSSSSEEAIIAEIDKTQDGAYKCKLCSHKAQIWPQLLQHDCQPFCQQCQAQFYSREQFHSHPCVNTPLSKDVGENSVQLFACGVCSKTFSNEVCVRNHLPLHTGQFACRVCGKWLRDQESLDSHEQPCRNPVHMLPCDHCGQVFEDVVAFRRHEYGVRYPIQCSTCKARFRNLATLDSHCCPGEMTICSDCHVHFDSVTELRNHQEAGCSPQQPLEEYVATFVCSICKMEFRTEESLTRHRKRNHQRKRFGCSKCGKRFSRKDLLKDHLPFHTGPSFQCQYCDKLFMYRKSLDVHLRLHTENDKRFRCPKCDKTFNQKGNLQKHLGTHNKNQRFECPRCYKSLSSKEYLHKHLRKHTDARNNTCLLCSRSYTKPHELSRHLRLCHQTSAQGQSSTDVQPQ